MGSLSINHHFQCHQWTSSTIYWKELKIIRAKRDIN